MLDRDFNAMTDLELWINTTKNEDKAAFEELYHRYYTPLLSYALRLRFDEETIKDSIQDVFVNIYVKRYTLSVPSSIKSYLYKSLINSLLDKTKSVHNDFISIDALPDVSIEDEGLLKLFKGNDDDWRQACSLKKTLEQLPSKQKNALYFRFIQEFTWEEMSVMFEMSEHSCMNLVGRGVSNVRALLKK